MAARSAFGLKQIGQIFVHVHDLKRAVSFYRDVLGMTYLFEVPNIAFFDCGGIRLMLDKPEQKAFDHSSSIIYYKVDDIHAAHDTLVSRGVQFEEPVKVIGQMPDHDLWMGFFRDSEQNLLALMSEVPRDK